MQRARWRKRERVGERERLREMEGETLGKYVVGKESQTLSLQA